MSERQTGAEISAARAEQKFFWVELIRAMMTYRQC